MSEYIYAIESNQSDDGSYYIVFGRSVHDAWSEFFNFNTHRLPLAEAIEAYEAIGYRAIKLKLERVKE